MADWEPIKAGKPQVQSDREYAEMVVVTVPLEPVPNADWQAIFNQGPPPGVTYSVSHPFPRVEGGYVIFRGSASDVQKQHDQAMRWVEGTNAEYERTVIPELERRRKAAEDDAEIRRRTVEEAQRLLEG